MSLQVGSKITVVYLLYNAERTVAALVDSIRAQRHPDHASQADWLEVIFMDDCSRDATAARLDAALQAAGRPAHFRVVRNEKNLGLSATLNKAFSLVRTPLVLTCHCDCFYGTPEYVATMARLLETNPRVGAITGQPALPAPDQRASIPTAEKINLISNLMDIFPSEPPAPGVELVPVGFAEGRCDAFRMEALARVGFYDTGLRVAGEYQVLASRMRAEGYEVCQAPRLAYELRVSDEQDTVTKLMRHEFKFGKVHPYILFLHSGTSSGVVGSRAGGNRQARTLLRAVQILCTFGYFWPFVGWALGLDWTICLAPLFFAKLAKGALFRRHLAEIPLRFREWIQLSLAQPLLDVSYTVGLAAGFVLLFQIRRAGAQAGPIT